MPLWKIIAELKQSPSCSVPTAGAALANMTRNTACVAAKNGTLGVPTFWAGGKLRVPSFAVLQKLGLAEPVEDAGQQAIEAPPDSMGGLQDQPHKTSAKLQRGPEHRTPLKKIRKPNPGYAARQDGGI